MSGSIHTKINPNSKHWNSSFSGKKIIPRVHNGAELVPSTDRKEIPVYCISKKCRCEKKKLVEYTVGIITAFAPEIEEFLSEFTQEFRPLDIVGRRFFRGIMSNKLVVITVCGIGMTNSAQTTQLIIDYFNPKYLFFSGIAGGMNPEQTDPETGRRRIGDVVVNSRWAEYQHQKFIRNKMDGESVLDDFQDFGVDFPNNFFRILPNRTLAFTRPDCTGCDNPDPDAPSEPGGVIVTVDIPGCPPPDPPPTFPLQILTATGFAIPMEVEVLRNGGDAFPPPGQIVPQQFFFNVDPYLLSLANTAISAPGFVLPDQITICGLDPCDCNAGSSTYQPVASIGDLGVAASTFVDNAIYRQDVFDQFQAGGVTVESVDMETSAFAHVAASNLKPFIAVRSLSDLAGGEEGINSILNFIVQAANNSVFVTVSIINLIPATVNKCCDFKTKAQLCKKECKKNH